MWGEEEKVQKFLKCFQPLETLFFFKLKSLSTVLECTLNHGIKSYAKSWNRKLCLVPWFHAGSSQLPVRVLPSPAHVASRRHSGHTAKPSKWTQKRKIRGSHLMQMHMKPHKIPV